MGNQRSASALWKKAAVKKKNLTPVPEVSDNPVDIVKTTLTNQGRGKRIKKPKKIIENAEDNFHSNDKLLVETNINARNGADFVPNIAIQELSSDEVDITDNASLSSDIDEEPSSGLKKSVKIVRGTFYDISLHIFIDTVVLALFIPTGHSNGSK